MTSLFLFFIGVTIGSFLNVLIDRLPNDEPITGRSHCDYCKKKIAWYDLIPIISFILLKGKCRYCHKKLSFQYPLVEFLTGIVFLGFMIYDSRFVNSSIFNLKSISTLGILSCLIVIFFSDFKYHLISDYILLALFVFSILFRLPSISHLAFYLVSGLMVAGPIYLIYDLSKERAMGLGDVYLSAIIGFLVGWKAGYLALYISFVTGAFFGILLIFLKNKKMKSKIAFGPFLVVGLITAMFFGDKILSLIRF